MPKTHKKVRGFQYLLFSMFSGVLLSVLVLLPLNPVFADEVSSDTQNQDSQSTTAEQPVQDEQKEQTEVATSDDETKVDTESAINENFEEIKNEEQLDMVSETVDHVDSPEIEIEEVANTIVNNEEDVPDLNTVDSEDSVNTSDVAADVDVPEEDMQQEDVVLSTETEEFSTSTNDLGSDLEENEQQEIIIDDETIIDEVLLMPQDEPQVAEVISTSTPLVPVMVVNDKNRFSFAKDECVSTGDGAFYCSKPVEAPALLHSDRIFSALDEDGDKEIYIEKSSVIEQLTHNTVDDDAPYYDEVSNTAVWHRLIEGRYQIVSYDFDTEVEALITTEHYNSMQPNRFGIVTVWQGWVGEDWEVFVDDGTDRKMLTDNTLHDILPTVNGDHIIWQAFEDSVWKVKVYDNRTGTIDTIENSEGGSIQNPRFVLVYDTETVEGDIETKGYDLTSGDVIELGSRPAQVPEELPDPDQTGEDRALVAPTIQPKNKLGSEEEDELDDLPYGDDLLPDTTASSTSDTIVIPPYGEVSEGVSDTASSTLYISEIEESYSDLVYQHIEDIIIPVYVGSSTDSQVPIAEE